MGNVREGLLEQLTMALAGQFGAQDFVETGTFLGDTTEWAAQRFTRVTTLELSPELHAAAQARFAGHAGVTCLRGDSAETLRSVVASLEGSAVFWLDGHWSGGETAGVEHECPVLAEIAAINESPYPHLVLVDDARLFLRPVPPPHQQAHWPSIHAVLDALRSGPYGAYSTVVDDAVVSVPRVLQDHLVSLLRGVAAA